MPRESPDVLTSPISPRLQRALLGLVGVVGSVCLVQLVVVAGVVPSRDVPKPTSLAIELAELVREGAFWNALGATIVQALTGLTFAVFIAVPAGLLIGASHWLWRAFRPTIEFLRPVPSVALIPVIMIMHGSSATSAIWLVVWVSVWPLLIQSIYGAREVDPIAKDTARAFNLSRTERFRSVLLPSAIPFVVTGLSLALVGSLIIAVTAELIVGSPGLGTEMRTAQNGADNERLYALVLVTGVLGLMLNSMLDRARGWVLRWHPSNGPIKELI